MSDLVFLSASQLAKAIRKRKVSAQEVRSAHLGHIARHSLVLNATFTRWLQEFDNRAN